MEMTANQAHSCLSDILQWRLGENPFNPIPGGEGMANLPTHRQI